MPGKVFVVALMSLFLLSSCKFPTSADESLLVSNLRFSPSAFDSYSKNTEIQYSLSSPTALSIYVMKKDSVGNYALVKTLADDISETKGTHRHTWLGETESNYFAPTGTYIGMIVIGSSKFEATVLIFHY